MLHSPEWTRSVRDWHAVKSQTFAIMCENSLSNGVTKCVQGTKFRTVSGHVTPARRAWRSAVASGLEPVAPSLATPRTKWRTKARSMVPRSSRTRSRRLSATSRQRAWAWSRFVDRRRRSSPRALTTGLLVSPRGPAGCAGNARGSAASRRRAPCVVRRISKRSGDERLPDERRQPLMRVAITICTPSHAVTGERSEEVGPEGLRPPTA